MSVVQTPYNKDQVQDFVLLPKSIEECCNELMFQCHIVNVKAGWWTDLQTGEKASRNVGEMLMLAVSELAEAMEGDRKDLMDDKLPHRKMMEVEIADCMIRLCDLAGAKGYNLGAAMAEKMAYNQSRLDHTLAHRAGADGKKY